VTLGTDLTLMRSCVRTLFLCALFFSASIQAYEVFQVSKGLGLEDSTVWLVPLHVGTTPVPEYKDSLPIGVSNMHIYLHTSVLYV
jgi:hypothetical protein